MVGGGGAVMELGYSNISPTLLLNGNVLLFFYY